MKQPKTTFMKKSNPEHKPIHPIGLNNGLNNLGLKAEAENSNPAYSTGEFERFLSFFISKSVESTMEKYFAKIPPKFYTPEQIGEILLVDEETVRRRCRSGALGFHQEGKGLRISLRQLNEYLATTEIKPIKTF